MKTENLPNFLYTDDFKNTHGLHVSTHHIINLKPHRHEFYELEYILEGETICKLNGETHHLYAGDFLFLTPLDLHSYTVVENQEALTTTIHFHLKHLHSNFSIVSELASSIIRKDPKLKEAFELLTKEQTNNPFQYFINRNILERIIIILLQKCNNRKTKPIPNEISYALGYINSHFNLPLTLDMVSAQCRYSTAYFCKQFKQYTGKSFVEYLTDLRIRHARNMLITQKLSVTQISYECGFGSTRNLHRIFRQKYGCSPGEYLKKHSASQEEQSHL